MIFADLYQICTNVLINFELPGWYSSHELAEVTPIDCGFYREFHTHHHFAIDIKCPSSRPDKDKAFDECYNNVMHTMKILLFLYQNIKFKSLSEVVSLKAVVKTQEDIDFLQHVSQVSYFSMLKNYIPMFLSPCFDENNKMCSEVDVPNLLCYNPIFKFWRLSLQTHKLIGVR